jgi:YggT family protein
MLIVLQELIFGIARVLDSVLWIYMLIVFGAVICSWVSADPRNGIVRFLYSATEPVLHWIRRRMPFVIQGGLDLSPLVLGLGLMLVRSVVVTALMRLGFQIEAG